jgi:hypothetical protein
MISVSRCGKIFAGIRLKIGPAHALSANSFLRNGKRPNRVANSMMPPSRSWMLAATPVSTEGLDQYPFQSNDLRARFLRKTMPRCSHECRTRGRPALSRARPAAQAVENAIDNARRLHDHIGRCLDRSMKTPGSKGMTALAEFRTITKYL